MRDTQPNLVITAGRVFCADTGLDGPGGVAVRGDRITAAGPGVAGQADEAFDYPDGILVPGLVDMHTHPAPADWRFGVDPDIEMLPRGATTVLSQGDAGASTWPTYRESIIEQSQTRVRLAINLAVKGELEDRGCFTVLEEADVEACVAAIEEGGEHIWGIAANVSERACGETDSREIMTRALEAAERTGRPILYGPRSGLSDWPLAEQLKLLRPGDIVTYCFHSPAEGIVIEGKVADPVWEARERGILFDVGHGWGNSDLGVALEAVADGFLPDTISSDVYKRHLGWNPPHDLPRTISRFILIGVSETEALARATLRPAEALGLAGQIGTLAAGAHADLAVLQWNLEPVPLADVSGSTRSGPCLEPVLTVRAGRIVGR